MPVRTVGGFGARWWMQLSRQKREKLERALVPCVEHEGCNVLFQACRRGEAANADTRRHLQRKSLSCLGPPVAWSDLQVPAGRECGGDACMFRHLAVSSNCLGR